MLFGPYCPHGFLQQWCRGTCGMIRDVYDEQDSHQLVIGLQARFEQLLWETCPVKGKWLWHLLLSLHLSRIDGCWQSTCLSLFHLLCITWTYADRPKEGEMSPLVDAQGRVGGAQCGFHGVSLFFLYFCMSKGQTEWLSNTLSSDDSPMTMYQKNLGTQARGVNGNFALKKSSPAIYLHCLPPIL